LWLPLYGSTRQEVGTSFFFLKEDKHRISFFKSFTERSLETRSTSSSPAYIQSGFFASLQWLHPNPKEVGGNLDTRQFFAVGVLQFVYALHQSIGSRSFFGSGFSVPRSAPEDFCGTIKGSNIVFLRVFVLLLDVQPSPTPPLDGFGEFDIEVVDIGMDADNNTAHIVGDIAGAVAAKIEDVLPQAPMRMGPEETFTQGDKDGDVEDGVRGQLM
jgi:hypothetical protein